jgi:hypothetical protein
LELLSQKHAASEGDPHVRATVHRNFDRLGFLWPDARYIHLVRDPGGVSRSVVNCRGRREHAVGLVRHEGSGRARVVLR